MAGKGEVKYAGLTCINPAVVTNRLLELHLVDLDATQFVFELLVEVECVSIIDLFGLWDLQEDSSLPKRQ